MHALAMPDESTREVGAPIGRDEIDPDLVKLSRTAPPVGLVAAVAVVVLCIALAVRLRHDFAYARVGDTPRVVTAAAVIAGQVADNTLVTVEGRPDLASAIRLYVTKGSSGVRMISTRGTDDRLWLAVPGNAWSRPAERDDRTTGRLRRLADVRYAGPLARALVRYPTPRFVTGAELRRARLANATQLLLLDGTTLEIAATAEVDLDLIDPNAAVVIATTTTDAPGAEVWGQRLTAAGLIPAGQAPIASTPTTVRWLVPRPVADVTAALDAAELWGARAEGSRINLRSSWSTLAADDRGVKTTQAVIPWSAIDVAAVWAPRTLPSGAWVVVADERPADYWYLWPIYVGLVLLAGLAGWALVRSVRREYFDRPTLAR